MFTDTTTTTTHQHQPSVMSIVAGKSCKTSAATEVSPTRPSGLSFAQTQIEAHGHIIGGRPVITAQNFVVDAEALQPLSEPKGDVYLSYMGIGASGQGDVVLSLSNIPGFVDACRRMGILHPSTVVFEVQPRLDEVVTGYPYTSPLERLTSDPAARERFQKFFEHRGKPIFVGTFLTERMRTLVTDIGCDFVQRANPAMTNNKYLFGSQGSNYGYRTMPQVRLDSPDDVTPAAELAHGGLLRRISRGDHLPEEVTLAWMKLSGGSGGDFVQKIAIRREEASSGDAMLYIKGAIQNARQRMYTSTRAAFVHNSYGDGALESFWPADSFCPSRCAIIIEEDVRSRGRVRVNASNLMTMNKDGTYSTNGYFRQITGPEGDYRGSMPFDPRTEFPPTLVEDLESNLLGIARLARDYNLHGFIGVDFFIVEPAPGQFEVVMTELNGRIPISGAAKIIADKLSAPAWINVNLTLPEAIREYADFEAQMGELARFSPGDFSECKVIPQAFRTMYDGETVIPSSQLKALIIGPSQAACMACLEHLSERGFA
jgi:hypothetical protein